MRLPFTKMHGLGNDFIVINAIAHPIILERQTIRALADRHFGIGCDQVLVVEAPDAPNNDFRYRIYNHDGSEVENCGNGARCFARFVQEQQLTGKNVIRVETLAGILVLHVHHDNTVTVDMGVPKLQPADIPLLSQTQSLRYLAEIDGTSVAFSALSMGNPHAVLHVDDVDTADVESLGAQLESHPLFPERVNVGFMAIQNRGLIHLRVYERGAGETLACGSGACAAVVAGCLQGLLDEQVTVRLPGGELSIAWAGESSPVFMTGAAVSVFHGEIELSE